MKKKWINFLLLAALCVPTAYGSLATDPTALMKGTTPTFSTSITFGSATYDFEGYVDYAVYSPSVYSGSLTLPSDEYVYAYQIFNSVNSDVSMDYLAIGLMPGITANNAFSDPSIGTTGGAMSASAGFVMSQSVMYMFSQPVTSGSKSTALVFTSEYGPQMGGAFVSGGIYGGVRRRRVSGSGMAICELGSRTCQVMAEFREHDGRQKSSPEDETSCVTPGS